MIHRKFLFPLWSFEVSTLVPFAIPIDGDERLKETIMASESSSTFDDGASHAPNSRIAWSPHTRDHMMPPCDTCLTMHVFESLFIDNMYA